MHSREIQTAAAVHFRLQVSILRLPGNHDSHNHGDGKSRTQYGYSAQQRILPQDRKGLTNSLHHNNYELLITILILPGVRRRSARYGWFV